MHLPSEFGLIIILVIVVLLFGGGRISRVSGELGTALREFRRGLNGGDLEQPEAPPAPVIAPETTVSPTATTVHPNGGTVKPTEKEIEQAKG